MIICQNANYLWSDNTAIRAKGVFVGVVDKLIAGLGDTKLSDIQQKL